VGQYGAVSGGVETSGVDAGASVYAGIRGPGHGVFSMSKFGKLFPTKTPEEVDRDPAYRRVQQEMAGVRAAMAPDAPLDEETVFRSNIALTLMEMSDEIAELREEIGRIKAHLVLD